MSHASRPRSIARLASFAHCVVGRVDRLIRAGRPLPFLTLLLLALLLLTLGPSPAAAQSPYPPRDGVLAVEEGIALSAERVQREFAERLGKAEVDGLFLVVKSCQPDPEAYLDEALAHYRLAPGAGQMYDDAVVWLVCYDPRFVGIYYSSENPLSPGFEQARVSELVAGAMGEKLAAGNLTGSLVSGIEGLAGALPRAAEAPAPAAGSGAAAPAGAPAAADASPPTTPDSDGDTGRMLAWLALGGCGLGGLWLWRRERDRKRSAAQRAAKDGESGSPREALAGKLTELKARLTADSPAFSRLALAYGSISDGAMLEVNQRHQAMVGRLAALDGRVGRLPAKADAAELASLSGEADQLLAYVDEVALEAEHVTMLQEKAAVLAVDARKTIQAVKEVYAARRPKLEGLNFPGSDQALAIPTLLVDQAESRLSAGDRLSAGRLAEDAQSLAERLSQLLERIGSLDQRIDEGVLLFDRVEAYAETNWADIRGNGSEAEESWEAAVTLLERILRGAEEAFGADPAAGFMASLEQVAGELDRAGHLVDAIGERLQRLDQARGTAVSGLDGLRKSIQEARSFLAGPEVGADVDQTPEGLLDQAAAAAQSIVALMGQEKPDWMAILRLLEEAQQQVAGALSDARAQDAQLDALKAVWETARQSAATAIDRAQGYLSSHRGDLDAASTGLLEPAQAALRAADEAWRQSAGLEDRARAERINAATSRAQEARDAADQAYQSLAAAIAREEQRRSYIPRPSWIGPIVPFPVDRRSMFPLDPFGGGGGGRIGAAGLPRPSGWGGRPRASTRPLGGGGGSSGTRRGGGQGW